MRSAATTKSVSPASAPPPVLATAASRKQVRIYYKQSKPMQVVVPKVNVSWPTVRYPLPCFVVAFSGCDISRKVRLAKALLHNSVDDSNVHCK